MRLRSPQLEKAIRSLARQELRSSPALLHEFDRRRRRWLVGRITAIVGWSLGLGTAVLLFSCVALFPEEPLPGERNGAELMLVAVGLAGSGYCVFAASGSGMDPGGLTSLALYAALCCPVRDRQLMARAARFWAAGIFLFTLFGVWWICEVCLALNRPVNWRHPAAVGIAILQASLVTAIFLWLTRLPNEHPLRIILGLLGFLVFAVGFVIAVVAGYREDMPNVVTRATFLLCPLGWAHGVLYWGVIQGQPDAYLLLVPAVATLGALVLWIRRTGWAHDFFFDPDKLTAAAAKNADRSSKRRSQTVVDITHDPGDRMPVVHATRSPTAGSTEAIERRLLEGHWLRGDDWTPWGPVDRFVLFALTPREKLLTECLHRRRSVLTWQWIFMLMLLVSIGYSFITKPLDEVSLGAIPLLITFLWGFAAVLTLRTMSGYHLLAPVGFCEISRTTLKVGLMKCLCWVPLTVGFCLAVGSRQGAPVVAAIGLGLLPVIVYLAWLPVSACIVFGPAIAEAAPWPARVFDLVCVSIALAASILFLIPPSVSRFLFIPLSVSRFFFAAVPFAATGAVWACCARILGGSGHKRGQDSFSEETISSSTAPWRKKRS